MLFFFFGGGGGVQKNKYFLGMKILCIFLGGHHKISLYLGVISMHFGSFLRSRYIMGVFGGLLKFHIFLGVLEIPVFFVYFFLGGGGER